MAVENKSDVEIEEQKQTVPESKDDVVKKVEGETETAEVVVDNDDIETLLSDDKKEEKLLAGRFKDVSELEKGYFNSSQEAMRLKKIADENATHAETVRKFNVLLSQRPDLYKQLQAAANTVDLGAEVSRGVPVEAATQMQKAELDPETKALLETVKKEREVRARAKVKEVLAKYPKLSGNKELIDRVKKTALGLANAYKDGEWIDYLEKSLSIEDPQAALEKAKVDGYVQAQRGQAGQMPAAPSTVKTGGVSAESQLTAEEKKVADKAGMSYERYLEVKNA